MPLLASRACGKSVTAQSILKLHDSAVTTYKDGEIVFEGKNLLELNEKELQSIRGNEISMIFQDPMTSLNPTMTIGKQIMEVLKKHEKQENGKPVTREQAKTCGGGRGG